MTKILWNKPKKIRSTEEHNKLTSFDGGPLGGYIPNMSLEDRCAWKGKAIYGNNSRVELRKSFPMAQVLIVVSGEGIKLSTNGSIKTSFEEWNEFMDVVNDAKEVLSKIIGQT